MKLYRDPELRRRMGEAARERIATEFRNEDTVRKTVALYEELVPVGEFPMEQSLLGHPDVGKELLEVVPLVKLTCGSSVSALPIRSIGTRREPIP